MHNPYETPKSHRVRSSDRKHGGRWVKHVCIYLILLLVVNFDRWFGSAEEVAKAREVSFTAIAMTLLLFYGAGYAIFSRVRSRR